MLTDNILKALDTLGYNTHYTEKRLRIAKYITEGSIAYHRKVYGENVDIILTGSRREGIGTATDTCNDVDQMFVNNSFLCVETEQMASDTYVNRVIFLLDTQSAPPGYALLKLFKLNTENAEIPSEIRKALTKRDVYFIVRNDKVVLNSLAPLRGAVPKGFTDGGWMKRTYELYKEKNGPSATYAMELPFTKRKLLYFDDCLAFPCIIPTLVKSWCDRKREFDWPSQSLITKIETMNGHVVPVGLKGSPDYKYQWRICLTQAEIELVESFNETQRKVYVVMKGLAKHVFRNICQSVSSYIIKNVIFWISEEVPLSRFRTKDFGARLHHALHNLQQYIRLRQLPSYMIAERNLLEGRVTDEQRQLLIDLLDTMLTEGPVVALRIPEVKKEINLPNEDIRIKRAKRRDMLEQIVMAPFALPPEEVSVVLRLFLNAKTIEHFLQIYMERVVPYIRMHNPEGFFPYLLVDDSEIFNFFLGFANAKL